VRSLLLGVAAFAAMEPVTAATHRVVMHGPGMVLHRSHHRRGRRRSSSGPAASTGWELNDAFPVMFAGVVCAALWLGFHSPRLVDLVPIGIGITAYGAAYAVVHDIYIHRRLRWFGDRRIAGLERLAMAHDLHHRYGGAPFGMLVPVVPRRLRSPQRVATVPGP